ncbi:MAG: hypothetical protein ACREQ9_14450 [Candidatus Binatia bacterium]
MVVSERASFALAEQLRGPHGAAVADVFSFLSGLYFRGKLAYARAFARPPVGLLGAMVITSSRGLVGVDDRITVACMREFAAVPIDLDEPRYRDPLTRDAERLARRSGPDCEFVLLGSVATPKYVAVLAGACGERLRFPAAFVGRGDMSRGGLMLRCVADGRELEYVPIGDGPRRGSRPPKLAPRRLTATVIG